MPSEKKKDFRVYARLEEKQFDFIIRKLKQKKYCDLDMSKLIRYALDEFFKNNRFEATETYNILFRVLVDLTLDMSRVSGNLNQIAYQLNTKETVENKEVIETLNELSHMYKELFENHKNLKEEVQKMSNGIYYS
ncbi:MAG: hypothetical protein ACNI3H_00590 [Halarcobacter ebronensis]|uniref:hypothetical protein n=1 Tax=Halarcobacter ebronensis TaxID=1462615 RepID=UPI003C789EC8